MTTKRLNAWLSREEVLKVLASVDTTAIGLRDAVVLRLGFTVGLRRQEIVDARWGDLKWPDQLKLVGKGGKAAIVAVTKSTLRAISEWEAALFSADLSGTYRPLVTSFRSNGWEGRTIQPTGTPMSTNSVREITLKYSGATGIAFAPHDMRRTFAGLLYEQTGSIETVSAALRHSNVGTTQRYLETRQDAAFQAVQKAGFDI